MTNIVEEILQEAKQIRQTIKSIGDELRMGGTVLREQMLAIEPGTYFNELSGISSFRLITNDPSQVFLLVIMGPRSHFRLHDHDCPELGTVVSGNVYIDDHLHSAISSFEFKAWQRHRLFSDLGCILLVEFPPN